MGTHSCLGCFFYFHCLGAALRPEVRLASWMCLCKSPTGLVLLNSPFKSMENLTKGVAIAATSRWRPTGIISIYMPESSWSISSVVR